MPTSILAEICPIHPVNHHVPVPGCKKLTQLQRSALCPSTSWIWLLRHRCPRDFPHCFCRSRSASQSPELVSCLSSHCVDSQLLCKKLEQLMSSRMSSHNQAGTIFMDHCVDHTGQDCITSGTGGCCLKDPNVDHYQHQQRHAVYRNAALGHCTARPLNALRAPPAENVFQGALRDNDRR